MNDPNGWPDASKPGVPLNPERDGWHWLDECVRQWSATEEAWLDDAGDIASTFLYARFRYLGPCHTPAEIAAMLAEAEARGREAGMREAAEIAEARANALCDFGKHVRAAGAEEAAKDIRAGFSLLARVEPTP